METKSRVDQPAFWNDQSFYKSFFLQDKTRQKLLKTFSFKMEGTPRNKEQKLVFQKFILFVFICFVGRACYLNGNGKKIMLISIIMMVAQHTAL